MNLHPESYGLKKMIIKKKFFRWSNNKTIFKYQRNFKFFKENIVDQLDMSICIFQILQKESGLEIE